MNIGDIVFVNISSSSTYITQVMIVSEKNEFGVIRVKTLGDNPYEFGTSPTFIFRTLEEVKLSLALRGHRLD